MKKNQVATDIALGQGDAGIIWYANYKEHEDDLSLIEIPVSKNGIISGICLGWARATGEFGVTIMLAGAIKFRTETLPIFIYLNISTGEIEGALYVAFIMIFLSFIILRLIKNSVLK